MITNFAPETAPETVNFIFRGRIIAGLADTTVLAESRVKGTGLLIAKLAADYGRAVFAVPGRLFEENYKGCNTLIREGLAKMVGDSFSIL